MSQSESAPIAMSHTAKSKAFRYLKAHEIEQHIRNPNAVYHDTQRDNYKIPVEREQHNQKWNHGRTEKVVLIVKPIEEESKYLIVSQTGDHYDWSEWDKVDSLPEVDS